MLFVTRARRIFSLKRSEPGNYHSSVRLKFIRYTNMEKFLNSGLCIVGTRCRSGVLINTPIDGRQYVALVVNGEEVSRCWVWDWERLCSESVKFDLYTDRAEEYKSSELDVSFDMFRYEKLPIRIFDGEITLCVGKHFDSWAWWVADVSVCRCLIACWGGGRIN